MPIKPGQTLLHYCIADKIGEGGMGEVWKAIDTTLDREVAIKVLPPQLAAYPERLARFDREAKLLASLNHPNIAAVYGFQEYEGVRFVVMELGGGEDLSQRIERGVWRPVRVRVGVHPLRSRVAVRGRDLGGGYLGRQSRNR